MQSNDRIGSGLGVSITQQMAVNHKGLLKLVMILMVVL